MNGAIPYHRIQERTAQAEKRTVGFRKGHPARTEELLCEMAHCVNNFLMRIQGWTSLMLLDVEEGQAGFKRLKHVENHIGYGAVLTSQLLACAGRGVYADPVNIPPLLLDSHNADTGSPGAYDVKCNLFIVTDSAGRVRPGRLSLCRDITRKIARLFIGIENVLLSGRQCGLEKRYLARIMQVTGEGFAMADNIAAGFTSGSGKPAASKRAPRRQRAKQLRIMPAAGFK